MDYAATIALCSFLIPFFVILCCISCRGNQKEEGGDVETGAGNPSGGHGLSDGNMVVLAGTGAAIADSETYQGCCCGGGDGGGDGGGGCGGCGGCGG